MTGDGRVRSEVVELLTCPHCSSGMTAGVGSVRCDRGHSFDIARQGYIGLLRGDEHLGTADTAAMVGARVRFLAAGHFDPLTRALVEQVGSVDVPGCVVDIGAGTGHHLASVIDAVPDRAGVALDVSRPALQRAARAHRGIIALRCDVWGRLPLRDEVAAVVLDVFAPRNPAEMARVLSAGGVVVMGTPSRDHLAELVNGLGLVTVDPDKEKRLRASMGGAHFTMVDRIEVEWVMSLDVDDMATVVAMGPSAHHVDPEIVGERLAPTAARSGVTASVVITVWRAG